MDFIQCKTSPTKGRNEAPRLYSRGIFRFFGGIRRSNTLLRTRLRRVIRIAFIHELTLLRSWSSAKADKPTAIVSSLSRLVKE